MIPLKIFLPDSSGGVTSAYLNLLKYIDRDKFDISLIISSTDSEIHPLVEKFPGVDMIHFQYSFRENQHTVLRRLSKLVKEEDLLLANDGIELAMADYCRLTNKLVFVLHGDFEYYYSMAVKREGVIDQFFTVSKFLSGKLLKNIPTRANSVQRICFPVPDVKIPPHESDGPLRLLYAGHLIKEKGVYLLPEIHALLEELQIPAEWVIAGSGKEEEILRKKFSHLNNVWFTGQITQTKLHEEMSTCDLLIFPSLSEGFGLVIVEAMKAGLVPLILNLPSDAASLIDGQNGFRLDAPEAALFAEKVHLFHRDRALLGEMKGNAQASAHASYPAGGCTSHIEQLLVQLYTSPARTKIWSGIRPGNRLDAPWFPNTFVKLIRKIRQ